MCFIGERTRFALGRKDVTRIEWTKEAPGWWPTKCARIAWRDGEFRLSPVHARSPWRLSEGGSMMRAGLRAWVEGRVAARTLPPGTNELGPPQPVAAKGMAPSARVSLVLLAEKGVIAALAAFLLRLSFGGDGSAWYVVLSALLCALFLTVPRVFAAPEQRPAPRPGPTAPET